ncbi:GNAT family N-acetyltransferase [Phenylobacterium sp.]|uniref:GNAT family N-acetyltransferase n=1 Tax=Phenylobacterium sp. TaxID=1871053 RepID=UPI00286CEBE5|nr:GNAT family N-acetyltransferase [Phenylobacterium sp.]
MSEGRTARLAFDGVTDGDAAFILELLNDPGWLANIGDRGVRTLDDTRTYIAERFNNGHWLVVRNGSTAEPLGLCGIVPTRLGLDLPDLGYAILARHSGKGYATEAAAALLARALGPLGHPRLAAFTSLANLASQRVLEKIGFRRLGVRRLLGHVDDSAYFETP